MHVLHWGGKKRAKVSLPKHKILAAMYAKPFLLKAGAHKYPPPKSSMGSPPSFKHEIESIDKTDVRNKKMALVYKQIACRRAVFSTTLLKR